MDADVQAQRRNACVSDGGCRRAAETDEEAESEEDATSETGDASEEDSSRSPAAPVPVAIVRPPSPSPSVSPPARVRPFAFPRPARYLTVLQTSPHASPRASQAARRRGASDSSNAAARPSPLEQELDRGLLSPRGDERPALALARQALSKLEKGNFAPALEDLQATIDAILGSYRLLSLLLGPTSLFCSLSCDVAESGEMSEERRGDVRFCAQYKLALKLLVELRLLEKDSRNQGAVAQLAAQLAQVALPWKHRQVCLRMAINKNMEVGNYGVAACILRSMLSRELPDRGSLEAKLKKCEEMGLADANPALLACPACEGRISPTDAQCPACSCPLFICFLVRALPRFLLLSPSFPPSLPPFRALTAPVQTFRIITDKQRSFCGFCEASFAADAVPASTVCPSCGYKKVERVPSPANK